MKDSVIDRVHVINQALSVEQLEDSIHFNQISAKDMYGFFDNGEIRKTEAIGNVLAAYFMQDDKDSSLMNLGTFVDITTRMRVDALLLNILLEKVNRSYSLLFIR